MSKREKIVEDMVNTNEEGIHAKMWNFHICTGEAAKTVQQVIDHFGICEQCQKHYQEYADSGPTLL